MTLAIHKIGGKDELKAEDMEKLWAPCASDPKYKEVVALPSITALLSDKFRTCAALGNMVALQFLLPKGGDINAVEEFTGNTALMIATGITHDFDKQKLIITYMMENGADCDIKNKYGLTPKSAIPGFADSPSVVHVREMDLKMKDKRRASQTK